MDEASSSQSIPTDCELDEFHSPAPADSESGTTRLVRGGGTTSKHEQISMGKAKSTAWITSDRVRSNDVASYRKVKSTGWHEDIFQEEGRGQHAQLDSLIQLPSELGDGSKPEKLKGCNPISSMRRSLLSGKIWRYMLYGKENSVSEAEERKDHPRSNVLCALLLISIILGATTTIMYFQLKSWPQATQSYYTDEPQDNKRGGLVYTCGCSLPSSLQSPENPPEKTNLNVCYDPSRLETVTVFMFSDSSSEGKDILNKVVDSITPVKKILTGYTVTQDAHELTVVNQQSFYDLTLVPLYNGTGSQPQTGSKPEVLYPSIDYLLGPNFNYFSDDYTHITFYYDCTNCDSCSLDNAIQFAANIGRGVFANCYYYKNINRCDTISKSYTAKCVLYPTGDFSPVFGIKVFLEQLRNLPGVVNMRGEHNEYHNATAFQSDVVYMSINDVTTSNISMNFVEVQKGSTLSDTLLNSHPHLATSCSSFGSSVNICNTVPVCRLFRQSGILGQECYDSGYCFLPEGLASPDALSVDMQQTLCNGRYPYPNSTCNVTSPELINWGSLADPTKWSILYDALDAFLDRRTNSLSDLGLYDKNKNAGVCSKTYKNVIRYDSPTATATTTPPESEQQDTQLDTMFLEADCTSSTLIQEKNSNTTVNEPALFVNATKTQSPFCWATGKFYSLSDRPSANASQLPEELYWANGKMFVCYRVGPEKFVTWFITAFGILFGWIGTIQLVFYAAFFWLFVPARKRMRKRSQRLEGEPEVHASEHLLGGSGPSGQQVGHEGGTGVL